MNDLQNKAKTLAAMPYRTEIGREELSDESIIFVASNPELLGCIGQGNTIIEALDDLSEVREKYIMSLLEDNLPVPSPSSTVETGFFGLTISGTVNFAMANHDVELSPAEELQPDDAAPNVYEYDSSDDLLIQAAV